MQKGLRLIIITLFFLMVFNFVLLHAETPIRATLNGVEIVFDQPPVIEDGRTLVPARAILEALGLDLKFDESSREVTAKNEEVTIVMMLDSDKVFVNDKEQLIDIPAKIISGRTMIPIRFIAEIMELKVHWDENQRLIKLDDKVEPKVEEQPEIKPSPKPVEITKDEDFSGECYANFPEIISLVDFLKINTEKTVIIKNEKNYLNYRIRYTEIEMEDIERYVKALEDDDFVSTTDKNKTETFSVITLSKDNTIIQIEFGNHDLWATITIYNTEYYTATDNKLTIINADSKKNGYYNMSETDITMAIQDGKNEANNRYRAKRKDEYYDYDAIVRKYKVSTDSPSLSKKDVDISIRTPYGDIMFESLGQNDKVFYILKKHHDFTEEEAKKIYEENYDFGNKVHVSFRFNDRDFKKCVKNNSMVIRQNTMGIEYEILDESDYYLDISIDLRTIDTSQSFEIIIPTINNSHLVYKINLSQYK